MTNPRPDRRDSSHWLRLRVRLPSRGEEQLLVEALRKLGARAVEQEGEHVLAFFPPCEGSGSLDRSAMGLIQAYTSLRDPDLTWSRISTQDWEQRRREGMVPRAVGRKFMVVPDQWDSGKGDRSGPGGPAPSPPAEDRLAIRLAPGAAFGDASHPTTRACLSELEELVGGGEKIADIGSGSGILAVAAALLGACRIDAFEMDPVAVDAATRNVLLNRVKAKVRVIPGEVGGKEGPSLHPTSYQGIIVNLEPDQMERVLPSTLESLAPDGWLLLAGIPAPDRKRIVTLVQGNRCKLVEERLEEGWWCGVLRRARTG